MSGAPDKAQALWDYLVESGRLRLLGEAAIALADLDLDIEMTLTSQDHDHVAQTSLLEIITEAVELVWPDAVIDVADESMPPGGIGRM